MKFIVTVSFDGMERKLNHNPRNKKTGRCIVSDYCTDVTGRHHSFLMEGPTKADVKFKVKKWLHDIKFHITRLEKVKE